MGSISKEYAIWHKERTLSASVCGVGASLIFVVSFNVYER
jgi:hypothetical protein